MKTFQLKLPKQYYLGDLPGRIMFLYEGAGSLYGMIAMFFGASNYFMLASMFFKLSIPIWQFYVAWLIGLITLAVFRWMFLAPSQYHVNNEQACKHDNPMMDLLGTMADKQGITEKDVEEWKRRKALGIKDEGDSV